MNIRTLLVDDHTMFREALHHMLDHDPEIEVVGEVGDGTEVIEAIDRLRPQIVVMDINMPIMNGVDATRTLLAKYPELRVIALSAFSYRRFVLEMMDAGATAYVVKSAAGDQLLHAIKSAAQGKTYLCPESASTLIEASRHASKESSGNGGKRLGNREIVILRLLAEGKSSPQIAEELNIASGTVDVHRRNIMQKLEIHSVAELTKYAIRIGLTSV